MPSIKNWEKELCMYWKMDSSIFPVNINEKDQ